MDKIPSQRIAVIGAGCSGIAALRALIARPSLFDVTVFEKKSHVGGIWNHDGKGPMYRDLRTNLPKPVMSFPDKVFKGESDRSFPTHQEVLKYIEGYLDETNARHLIKHNTEVLNVQPVDDRQDGTRWCVRFGSSDGNHEEFFHAIFVCNGHFDVPIVPEIPGIEDFCGQVLHSKDYDEPEVFAGKKVIVLGARASGLDIAIGISPFAKEVIVSHRQPNFPYDLPPEVKTVAGLKSFKDGAFCLTDGSRVSGVDVVIFCTGYSYSFPFLHPDCGITAKDGYCWPLWRHFVNVRHPSMFLLGVTQLVTPLPQVGLQATLAVAVLEGRVSLPPAEAMLAEIEADFQKRIVETGERASRFHVLSKTQWDYNDGLADFGGFSRLPRYMGKMYQDASERRKNELLDYRFYNYLITSDEDFELEKIKQ